MKPALAGLLLLLSGCFQTTIINGMPDERTAMIGGKWKHGFIHGLIEPDTIDIDHACPNGGRWLRIEEKMTLAASLAHLATLGIYTPRVVLVFCSGGEAITGVVDDEGRLIAIDRSD